MKVFDITSVDGENFLDFFGYFVFYFKQNRNNKKNLGVTISSDKWVLFGIVFYLWLWNISFWVQKDNLNHHWKTAR